MGITNHPAVKYSLALVVVGFIAKLGIATSIKAALQAGNVEAAGLVGVVILGWVFTGMRSR